VTLPFLAGVAIFLSMSCGVALAQPLDWAEYRNEKFGFALDYPRDLFEVERTAQAGDGQVFVTREGDARLLVGALLNGPDFTPNAYQKHIARQSYGDYKITYRRKHGTWFVLSGEGRGKVFYEKVMFSCSGRLINSFAMIYPADKRDVFNPIVERMEDTFRPGKACHGADMPSAKPRATQGPSRVRTRWTNAPRSPLADGIAKQRGGDVIVILRRTTPPYDRKVVRGYVSRP
jgi:hypothetical protein